MKFKVLIKKPFLIQEIVAKLKKFRAGRECWWKLYQLERADRADFRCRGNLWQHAVQKQEATSANIPSLELTMTSHMDKIPFPYIWTATYLPGIGGLHWRRTASPSNACRTLSWQTGFDLWFCWELPIWTWIFLKRSPYSPRFMIVTSKINAKLENEVIKQSNDKEKIENMEKD